MRFEFEQCKERSPDKVRGLSMLFEPRLCRGEFMGKATQHIQIHQHVSRVFLFHISHSLQIVPNSPQKANTPRLGGVQLIKVRGSRLWHLLQHGI